MRRLPRSDLFATLWVLAAAIVYVLWVQDAAFTGVSTRVVAAVVFGLGFAACVSNEEGVGAVFGADPKQPRAPIPYVVLASALGAAALVFGILAIVGGGETMLLALVASIGGLWLVATARHELLAAHQRHPHPSRA